MCCLHSCKTSLRSSPLRVGGSQEKKERRSHRSGLGKARRTKQKKALASLFLGCLGVRFIAEDRKVVGNWRPTPNISKYCPKWVLNSGKRIQVFSLCSCNSAPPESRLKTLLHINPLFLILWVNSNCDYSGLIGFIHETWISFRKFSNMHYLDTILKLWLNFSHLLISWQCWLTSWSISSATTKSAYLD